MYTPEEQKINDPFRLDSVSVHTILEHLDEDSLLTNRLVCRSWNRTITTSAGLWKKLCQRKGAVHSSHSTSSAPSESENYYFGLYLGEHHVYRQMTTGASFRVQVKTDMLSCFYDVGDDRTRLRMSGAMFNFWDHSISEIFARSSQVLLSSMSEAIVFTHLGDLAFVNLETKQVHRSSEKSMKLAFLDHVVDYVYAVSSSGNIKQFSQDGRSVRNIDTGGKLKGAEEMWVHPRCRYLLVRIGIDDVSLVDVDKGMVFPLCLPVPPLSQEEDDEEHETACRPMPRYDDIDHIGFLSDKELKDDQLAICVFRLYSMCVAIINTRGVVLHHAFKTFYRRLAWTGSLLYKSLESQVLIDTAEDIENYAIHCESGGISFRLLWKTSSAGFNSATYNYLTSLPAGNKFFMLIRDHDLEIYRLEDGGRLCSFPGFIPGHLRPSLLEVYDATGGDPELIARRAQVKRATDKARSNLSLGTVILTNLLWLNGLSPETTRPDVPVLLCVGNKSQEIVRLHWSEGLWPDVDLKPEDE